MTTAVTAANLGSESEVVMDRVAISVLRDYNGLCASMDERFGRAKAFLVIDKKTGKPIETIGYVYSVRCAYDDDHGKRDV